jgi:2-amino-4-hydroxy-6-hydroxymethyldihydropteridine diphosphokinase
VRAWIGLGANLGDPLEQMVQARRLLAGDPLSSLLAASSIYRTAPWGCPDQPVFLNAVLLLETGQDAASLFARMARIEDSLGRFRGGPRWGPRTIDLDLLLFGDSNHGKPMGGSMDGSGTLRLPHPRMHLRRFVLEPLHELAPNLRIPGRGRVDDLLANLIASERRSGDRESCRRLHEPRWDLPAASRAKCEKTVRRHLRPGARTTVH